MGVTGLFSLSKPLTVGDTGVWIKPVKSLQREMAAAPSAVLPRADAFEQTTPGYEGNFSFDLRIPHSDQCAQALQCPPSQQKLNLWTVYQFTQTDSKVRGTGLAHSSSLCKAFETNKSFCAKVDEIRCFPIIPRVLLWREHYREHGCHGVGTPRRYRVLFFFCTCITLNVPLSSR